MNFEKSGSSKHLIISQVRRQGTGVCKNNRAGDTLSHFPFLVDVASNLKEESHSQRFREFFNITYVSSLLYYEG